MGATELLLWSGAPTPPTGALRGQFVIETPNPFIHMGYPEARPNRFFLAEIDVLWERDRDAAQRIMDAALALGVNHVMTGPVRADGYKNHFPATNWFGRAPLFAAFYRWLRSQVNVSMVVMTDIAPWYLDGAKQFDWDAIHRDFDPFYDQLRAEGVVFDRVVSQWEQYQRRSVCAVLFQWMAERFPEAKRYWHNPVNPPHLSPGASDEEERGTWESALRYLDGLYQQDDTIGAYVINSDGRTPFGQMQYDLWDMSRRALGINSPWGAPLLNYHGVPMEVVWTEATAYWMYRTDDPNAQAVVSEWGRGALSATPHVTQALDGIP